MKTQKEGFILMFVIGKLTKMNFVKNLKGYMWAVCQLESFERRKNRAYSKEFNKK